MERNSGISRDFFRFPAQIIHFLSLPLFFLLFLSVYRPPAIMDFIAAGGGLSLEFNLTMLTCILLLVLVGTRLAFFFLRKHLSPGGFLYALWCLGETAIFAAFGALYLTLVCAEPESYFEVLPKALFYFSGVLVWPYLIIYLGFEAARKDPGEIADPSEGEGMVRFTDETQRLKLAVTAGSLLYVQANVNYVNIYYLDSDKVKTYQLRSSMKRLEETLEKHGLRRCHRAYFVNPVHIKALRKDSEGLIFADLDTGRSIPVSKTYYDSIAAKL